MAVKFRRYSSNTRKAAKLLLNSNLFTEAEIASLLSVQLINIKNTVANEGTQSKSNDRGVRS